jgi:endonuclease III related protein
MQASDSYKISAVISGLSNQYGPIVWWQGSADEVIAGAVLTQQTRWENVERALICLRDAGIRDVVDIHHASAEALEEPIRCTGFYRVKARRLKNLAAHIVKDFGTTEKMSSLPTDQLREGLLAVNGVGEETADSILCYGFNRTTFVIDAYTERICRCAGVRAARRDLKALFEAVLQPDTGAYREAHAHIVEFAKEFCVRKRCQDCWIKSLNG